MNEKQITACCNRLAETSATMAEGFREEMERADALARDAAAVRKQAWAAYRDVMEDGSLVGGFRFNGWGNPVERKLMCFVKALRFDYEKQAVQMLLKDGSCTDMGGAISVAKTYMPDCKVIYTYSGDEPDVAYVKTGKEGFGWEARDFSKRAA